VRVIAGSALAAGRAMARRSVRVEAGQHQKERADEFGIDRRTVPRYLGDPAP